MKIIYKIFIKSLECTNPSITLVNSQNNCHSKNLSRIRDGLPLPNVTQKGYPSRVK